tara:strand:+ start:19431 stop:20750 length:1320 start_codon:yes stop_codon:yes gene_type:complete
MKTEISENKSERMKIVGGSIIGTNGESTEKKNIWIDNGRIANLTDPDVEVEKSPPQHVIDASECIVSRLLVDTSVRFKEPGFEYKSSLMSELFAAVAGGIGFLSCPPDTEPCLDEPGSVEILKKRAEAYGMAKIYPLGALTSGLNGSQLTEMAELSRAGCIGFSQANVPLKDTLVLFKALQYASSFDFRVWLSPIDPWLSRGAAIHSGVVSSRLGLSGVPSCAETINLMTILELAKLTGVKLHVCRISTADSVNLIKKAKSDGLNVTCDVSVHHLHLTEYDVGDFYTFSSVFPPFRTERDRTALTAGVLDGTIDCICSDHTPIKPERKNLPFGEAVPGVVGLELLLPLTLSWAEKQKITLSQAISMITFRPAKIMNLEYPEIKVGEAANLCIFNPESYWILNDTNLVSQGKNTPFYGYELKGKVKATIINGRLVYPLLN